MRESEGLIEIREIIEMSEYVIETEGLSKAYNGIFALKNFSLKVPKHSIFGFLGPNGAGKTTAIKLMLGLKRPTSGSGFLLGHDIIKESREVRRHVGYLAQNPCYYAHMTSREILRFSARFFYSGQDDKVEARIDELIKLAGLEDKADRLIMGFSGGEKQRLGLAQAQINHPDLLILDEPAAGLDPQGRHDVLEVMERLRKYTTIFYSTHILDDVQRISDTVAILNKGELIACAPIKELLAGSQGVVYKLLIKGDSSAAYSQVSKQDWVSSLQTESIDGKTRWHVSVTDETSAENELLRLVMKDDQIIVKEFGIHEYELEDIFLNIVEESNNGN